MLDKSKNKNPLSVANFKTLTGELVNPNELSPEDKIDFHLALLLNTTIETLELSIQNDRIFSRAKLEVMSKFHATRDNLLGIEKHGK